MRSYNQGIFILTHALLDIFTHVRKSCSWKDLGAEG